MGHWNVDYEVQALGDAGGGLVDHLNVSNWNLVVDVFVHGGASFQVGIVGEQGSFLAVLGKNRVDQDMTFLVVVLEPDLAGPFQMGAQCLFESFLG